MTFATWRLALALGLVAANVVRPGAGFAGTPSEAARAAAQKQVEAGPEESGLVPFLLNGVLPSSVVEPFVGNKILQILMLAILTACVVSSLAPRLREHIVGAFEHLSKVIFGLIRLLPRFLAKLESAGASLTNAIGNCVATMVIAKWQGERDDERFAAVLDDPTLVDADVERATVASDRDTEAPTDPQRDDEREPARSQ